MTEVRPETLAELKRVMTEQRADQYRQYYRIERGFSSLEEMFQQTLAQKDERIAALETQLLEIRQQMTEQQRLLLLLLETAAFSSSSNAGIAPPRTTSETLQAVVAEGLATPATLASVHNNQRLTEAEPASLLASPGSTPGALQTIAARDAAVFIPSDTGQFGTAEPNGEMTEQSGQIETPVEEPRIKLPDFGKPFPGLLEMVITAAKKPDRPALDEVWEDEDQTEEHSEAQVGYEESRNSAEATASFDTADMRLGHYELATQTGNRAASGRRHGSRRFTRLLTLLVCIFLTLGIVVAISLRHR